MEQNLDTQICCPVCLEESNSQDFIRPCTICNDTYIHRKCFTRMINYNLRSCPTCRTPYGINNHIIIEIEPISENLNIQQFTYENENSYIEIIGSIINKIFLLLSSLYFAGCFGAMLLAIFNAEYVTFNPFNEFFILQVIFGSFICLIITSLFDIKSS